MATIRVSRPSGQIRDLLRAYRILVDDEEVGTVRSGKSLNVSTTSGVHRLRAVVAMLVVGDIGSEPIEIEVANDAIAAFVVQPMGRALYKGELAYSRRTSYLELVPA